MRLKTFARARPLLGDWIGPVIVIAAAFAILTLGGVFRFDSATAQVGKTVHVARVATMRAVRVGSYEIDRSFVGSVEADRESHLSFEQGGLVSEILVDEGDRVIRGDVIARQDVQLLEAERKAIVAQYNGASATLDEMIAGPRKESIEEARARVANWTAQKRLAERTRLRQAELMRRSAGSQQTLDDATFGQQAIEGQLQAAQAALLELVNGTRAEVIAAQRAEVDRLAAELESIEIRLAKSTLRAPFSGTIGLRMLDEGTVIDPGSPVVQLIETDRLLVRIGVTSNAMAELAPGQIRRVEIDGVAVDAVVRASRPDRDPRTRTIGLILELPKTCARQPLHSDRCGENIHVGDLATLNLQRQVDEPGFWLPISALSESHRGLWAAYVVVANDSNNSTHILEQRELELLHQSSDNAFVRGSLRDGEQVVREGIQRLVPNQSVRLSVPRDPAVHSLVTAH